MRTRSLLPVLLALAAGVVALLSFLRPGERPAAATTKAERLAGRSPEAPAALQPAAGEPAVKTSPALPAVERTPVPDGLGALAVRVVEGEGELALAGVPLRLRREPGWTRDATSGDDGGSRFEDLEPGDYTLASGPSGELDFVAAPLPVRIARDGTEEVLLRVERRWFLAGVVVEQRGAHPVAGVGLMARDAGGQRSIVGTSGAEGRFKSRRSYPAGPLSLFLSEEETEGLLRTHGDGPELLQVTVGREDVARLVVELDWVGVLRGVVLGPHGRPIPRAELRVLSADSIYLENAPLRFWGLYPGLRARGRTAASDAEGRFAFGRLPDDRTLVVVASAAGFASGRSAELAPPFLAGDDPVVLRLEQGGSIVGRVLDAQGAPLEQATVSALSRDTGYQPDPASSDAEGAFRLDGLKPGPTEVTAQVRDEGGLSHLVAGGEIEVLAGREVELVLQAGAGGVHVRGIAVDQDGGLVTGDRVRLSVRAVPLEPLPGEPAWGHDTPVDEDGDFDVTVARSAAYRLALLSSTAGDPWEFQEVEAPADGVRLTFPVAPTSVLVLRALDAGTGEPVQRGLYQISWDRGSIGGDFTGGGSSTVVRAGRYTVTMSSQGYASTSRELDLRGSLQPETLVELPLGRGRPVSGRVLDATGQPVKGCTLVLSSGGQLDTRNLVYSGADGRFTFPAAPLEGGTVCVIDESYRILASAEIGAGEVVLTLEAR